MKHGAPRQARDAVKHWQAAREGRLAIQQCPSCSKFEWPPRRRCSACNRETEWRDVSGNGTVASYSVVHRAVNPDLESEIPYVMAMVDLDEGVRLLTNLVDCDPETVHCGQKVSVRFEPTSDPEFWVPVFAPSGKGG